MSNMPSPCPVCGMKVEIYVVDGAVEHPENAKCILSKIIFSCEDWDKITNREATSGYKSLRVELARLFGSVVPHHGMNWNASMISRIGDKLCELEKKIAQLDLDLEHEVGNSEFASEWAEKLSSAIAPTDVIGEHSNMNNPWANALEYYENEIEIDAVRAEMKKKIDEALETVPPMVVSFLKEAYKYFSACKNKDMARCESRSLRECEACNKLCEIIDEDIWIPEEWKGAITEIISPQTSGEDRE